MTDTVTYTRTDLVSTVVMDDGKVNVFSIPMLRALHEAFDQAERDRDGGPLEREAGLLHRGFRPADAQRAPPGCRHPPELGGVAGRAHPVLPRPGHDRLHRPRVPRRCIPPDGGRCASRCRRTIPTGTQRGPDRADAAVVRHRARPAPSDPRPLRPRRGDRRDVRPWDGQGGRAARRRRPARTSSIPERTASPRTWPRSIVRRTPPPSCACANQCSTSSGSPWKLSWLGPLPAAEEETGHSAPSDP